MLADWGADVTRTRPFLGDYDRSRLASRVRDVDQRRTLMVLHLLGPGHPALYYGDELDLADATTLPVDSPWRAPMPWSPAWNCGFSTAEPWFEADPACKVGWNAYDEARDPDSMLALVRWLGGVRAAWGGDDATVVPSGWGDVLAMRTGSLLVLGSVATVERDVAVDAGVDLATGQAVGGTITLAPAGWRVVRTRSD